MIQTFHFRVPLGEAEADPLIATLRDKLERLVRLKPTLRGVRLEASEGFLLMSLRCAGHNRWACSYDARRIAATMLNRVKLDVNAAELISIESEKTSRNLTKETGRNPGHTPRGSRRKATEWEHLPWWGDEVDSPSPQDP